MQCLLVSSSFPAFPVFLSGYLFSSWRNTSTAVQICWLDVSVALSSLGFSLGHFKHDTTSRPSNRVYLITENTRGNLYVSNRAMYSSNRRSLHSAFDSHSTLQLLASFVLAIPLLILAACFCTGLIWNQQQHKHIDLLTENGFFQQKVKGPSGSRIDIHSDAKSMDHSLQDSSDIEDKLGTALSRPSDVSNLFSFPRRLNLKHEAHSWQWTGCDRSGPSNPLPLVNSPGLGKVHQTSMGLSSNLGYDKVEKRTDKLGPSGQGMDKAMEKTRSADSTLSGGSGPSINVELVSDHFRKLYAGEPIPKHERQQSMSPRASLGSKGQGKEMPLKVPDRRVNPFKDLNEQRELEQGLASMHLSDHGQRGTQYQRSLRGYDKTPDESWLSRKEWKHPDQTVQDKWQREQSNPGKKLPAYHKTSKGAHLSGHVDKHPGETVTIRPDWRTQSSSTPRMIWTNQGNIHRTPSMTSFGRYGGSQFLQGNSPLQVLPGASIRHPPKNLKIAPLNLRNPERLDHRTKTKSQSQIALNELGGRQPTAWAGAKVQKRKKNPDSRDEQPPKRPSSVGKLES